MREFGVLICKEPITVSEDGKYVKSTNAQLENKALIIRKSDIKVFEITLKVYFKENTKQI